VSGNLIHDSSKKEFLAQEHVDEADIVVTTLDSDEKNLLISVLAKRIGVDRVIAVVDNTEYVTLFEEIGIDVAINPREVTVFTMLYLFLFMFAASSSCSILRG
jgi:trk system potassium uptake protein TrkA